MQRFISLFLLALGLMVCASPLQASQVRFGFHGGGNISSIKTTPSTDFQTRRGLILGVHADIGLLKWLSFQPELHYVQKGAFVPGTLVGQGSSTVTGLLPSGSKLRLDSIELPLLIKIQTTGFSWQPFFITGPALSLKVKAQVSDTDLTNAKSLGLGWQMGGGIEFSFGSMGVFLSARYHLGLLEILEGSSVSYKNEGIYVVGGYRQAF